MDGEVQLSLESVYETYELTLAAIGRGEFNHAYTLLKKLLQKNLDNPQLFEVMKCLKFWNHRLDQLLESDVGVTRAQLLEDHWSQFEHFVEKYTIQAGRALEYFKQGVFQKIIDSYNIALEKSNYSNVDYLLNIATQFRALANYPKALETLTYAQTLSPHEAKIKILLADTLYLSGDTAHALSLYRHHFFTMQASLRKEMLHPFEHAITLFKAPLIWEVVLAMRAEGFFNSELASWLPVYAVLEGLFPLKMLCPFHKTDAVMSLSEVIKRVWERELAFRESKWTSHLLEGELVYSYLYVLDEISLTLLDSKSLSPATASHGAFDDKINKECPPNLNPNLDANPKTIRKTTPETTFNTTPHHTAPEELSTSETRPDPKFTKPTSADPTSSKPTAPVHNPSINPEDPPISLMLDEVPTLLSNLKALSPQLYERLEYRYAHFT